MVRPDRLRLADYLIVGLFSLALFGYAGWSGRPLTMHEARLPQTSREMLAGGEWLLPTSGGRPWLERPPLPHWVVIASLTVAQAIGTGRYAVWPYRLPSAVLGTATVLLTMGMAARCFGRTIGLLAGVVLATSFEFYTYACSAEDDVYLAALVAVAIALFVRRTFPGDGEAGGSFWGGRPLDVWAFFAVVGLTNLTKGPLLGVAFVGSAVGSFAVWQGLATGRWTTFARYTWLWGWLLMLGLTVAWPAWAYHRHPDVLANWRYDYLGRVSGAYSDINQPWYYYAPTWAAALLPWTPAALVGLMATFATVTRRRATPVPADPLAAAWRFVWCWAFVPLLLLSIPRGKHHHYLVPLMAPSAILAAAGVREVGRSLLALSGPPGVRSPWVMAPSLGLPAVATAVLYGGRQAPAPLVPLVPLVVLAVVWMAAVFAFADALRRRSGPGMVVAVLVLIGFAYGWAMTYTAATSDHTAYDTAFLARVRSGVPQGDPLFIDAKLGPPGNLDFFRLQFYSRPDAVLLHNLSYLRDRRITAPTVYVLARRDADRPLATLGTLKRIDVSRDSHEAVVAGRDYGNFTLFRLTFAPNLKRYPTPLAVTSLQAMERAESTDPGPWCGPPL